MQYQDGAPSLVITRIMQPMMNGYGVQQAHECYFSVLATEFRQAIRIPCLNPNVIYFEYISTIKSYCMLSIVNRTGHVGKGCHMKDVPNAAGYRDACIVCGSVDH